MPVVAAPLESYVITPSEAAAVDKFLEDFDREAEEKAKRGKVKLNTFSRQTLAAGAVAGVMALLLPWTLAKLGTLEDYLLDTRRRRRKRHNECTKACLEIIQLAADEVTALASYRALETDDTEKKKRAEFESRA